ncbi:RelA/SpoT domain-containing protein [Fusobacterium nucleatum]|uniref:RelA/SpoT domain-containing protein n=1 Tax=Fusobacterium nucleatum TaxID=851 RepID=UPI00235E37B7|nr:RelA/SpoT domain-containing protein [Fusobacterium nucleatum]WDD88793.1 RelA/SpoT domain-containing protein [Fusobacterium nucleatum]
MSIRKIGEKLREGIELTEEEKLEFDNFREAHNIIIKLFTIELKKVNFSKQHLTASRNKRIETIISKLCRPEKPKLDRIHDIAGTRIIFENIKSLEDYIDILENTELVNFKEKINEDKNRYNYIKNPKSDGYRSIHKVFYYSSNTPYSTLNEKRFNLENKKIELQLRTRLQHIWATTVEIYDIINKSNIKTGTHNKLETKEGLFFKKCSLVFEGIESNDVEKIKININEIFRDKDLVEIYNRLKGIKNIKNIQLPKTLGSDEVFILITDLNKGKTTFFTTDPIEKNDKQDTFLINASYRRLEEKNTKGEYILLLLTLGDIKKLKNVYPNYFLNTNKFISILKKYKDKYIKEED